MIRKLSFKLLQTVEAYQGIKSIQEKGHLMD